MSHDKDSLQNAQNRLSEIKDEANRLNDAITESFREAFLSVEKPVEELRKVRRVKSDLANLRAETTYLRLSHDVEADEPEIPETSIDELEALWKEMRVASQPVRASRAWLEKIRGVEKKMDLVILA